MDEMTILQAISTNGSKETIRTIVSIPSRESEKAIISFLRCNTVLELSQRVSWVLREDGKFLKVKRDK